MPIMIEPLSIGAVAVSAGKWIAGGVSTWMVARKTVWSKKRELHRGLYREMAANYGVLERFINGGSNRMAMAANGSAPVAIDDRYYRFVLTDMPHFQALREYNFVTSIYEQLQTATCSRGAEVISAIVVCRLAMDEAMATGLLSKRKFRRYARKQLRAAIDTNVRERAADLKKISTGDARAR